VRSADQRISDAIDSQVQAERGVGEGASWSDPFVSLLSDNGIPIDEIARLVGHSSTAVTELVYRQQIRPVLQSGAVVMDRIFNEESDA
jgi:hypothetical protein